MYGIYSKLKEHPAGYPVVTAIFLAFCSAMFAFDERLRVFPELRSSYLLLKVAISTSSLLFAFWFYKRGANDLSLGLFAVLINLYVLAFIWYAPLYEMAYLQGSIAASFYRFRRRWIFPSVFAAGLLGILVTYHIQDGMNWQLPPETRSDWVLISLIMFLVATLVQRFAIGQTYRERDRMEKLSTLGHDAVRILHDVKGLSSTPFLLSQRLSDADDLKDLASSIERVQKFLRATQRLVNVQENVKRVQLDHLLSMVLETLDVRLRGVTVKAPETQMELECNPNRLFSILYNVLLILSENFPNTEGHDPCITIAVDQQRLIVSDNSGQRSVLDGGGVQGLRERVIASDLRHMNWAGGFIRIASENRFEAQLA